MDFKRILFIGDTHCGHIGGLTPPAWWKSESWCEMIGRDWLMVEKKGYNWFKETVNQLKPIYGVAVGGDMGDGSQRKERGLDIIETDITKQAGMAIQLLKLTESERYACIYGTPYHVGDQFEIDKAVALGLDAPIAPVQDIVVNGCRIRIRHKIGGTSTPVGGDIALRKKEVFNKLWHFNQGLPLADLQVFFHVHRWRKIDDCVMTCPGLQAWTNYGSMQCDGEIHFGLAWVDIYEDGHFITDKKFLKLSEMDNLEDIQW